MCALNSMSAYLEADCHLSAIQIYVVLLQCINNTLDIWNRLKIGYNQYKVTFWFQFHMENKSILYRTDTVSKQFCQISKQCKLHFGLSIGKTA